MASVVGPRKFDDFVVKRLAPSEFWSDPESPVMTILNQRMEAAQEAMAKRLTADLYRSGYPLIPKEAYRRLH